MWQVPERAGPGPGDASSMLWMYHSHTDEAADTSAGLFGPIIIARKGMAKADGSPKDVDKEFALMFYTIDESSSFLSGLNVRTYLPNVDRNQSLLHSLTRDQDFKESNKKHSINGLSFCNLPGLAMERGAVARLHIMGLGSNEGFHTMFSEAASLDLGASRAQAVRIMPGMMQTLDVRPELPGQWVLQCHVQAHANGGMMALYSVSNKTMALTAASGKTRTYFISADEVQWDYAPQGKDVCTDTAFTDKQKVRCVACHVTLVAALARCCLETTFQTMGCTALP